MTLFMRVLGTDELYYYGHLIVFLPNGDASKARVRRCDCVDPENEHREVWRTAEYE